MIVYISDKNGIINPACADKHYFERDEIIELDFAGTA